MQDEKIRQNSDYLLPTLKTRKEFLAIRSGKRVVTEWFIAQARPNDADSRLRVGYTVTKKVGNAVARNRIRRRLKHALAESRNRRDKNAQIMSGSDLVLVAKPTILHVPFATLVDELTKSIDRLVTKGNNAAK